MNLNSPTTARLTPASSAVPAGMTVTREVVSPGLPYRFAIEPAGLQVTATLSTGLLRPLTKVDAATTVAASTDQTGPREGQDSDGTAMLDVARAAASPRLLFISGTRLVGQCPLILGHRILIPTAKGVNSAGIEMRVLGFAFNVSALLGQNATASWIEIAWREIAAGTDAFDSAVLRPALHGRVFYSRGADDGTARTIRIEDDNPTSGVTVTEAGLNWRMMHDRI